MDVMLVRPSLHKILFNSCVSVCRLYVHDLFSVAIYFCNPSTSRITVFPLSSEALLNTLLHAVIVPVSAASLQSIDPSQQFTWEHSNLEVNKPKNRYANVIAYDHTRVILAPIEGERRQAVGSCSDALIGRSVGIQERNGWGRWGLLDG